MNGSSTATRTGTAVMGVVASAGQASRAAAAGLLTRAAWSWAGVPSGPLGWVSSHWTMPRLHAELYRVMARELDLRPEDDLLEVACGSGAFLAGPAANVHHVAGLDRSSIQVRLARERLAERIAAGTAEIVEGDAARLPWPADTFSVVTVMGSFECFPEPERALAELARVLRPGGRAVLNIGEQVEPGTPTHRAMNDTFWVWSEDDVRSMVERAGFTGVTITYASSAVGRVDEMISQLVGPIGADLRLVHAGKA